MPDNFTGYPIQYRDRITNAVSEAFGWLEREGLITQKAGPGSHGWFFVSRRGKRLKGHLDVDAYRRANLLPKALLHPLIATKVWSDFLRGTYDAAVFKAFKEVEVEVRTAGKFDATELGVT